MSPLRKNFCAPRPSNVSFDISFRLKRLEPLFHAVSCIRVPVMQDIGSKGCLTMSALGH